MKKPKKKATEDKDIISEALKRYQISVEAEEECRELALDDVDFRNGDQWHPEDKSQRLAEGRPCLTINKLEQRVDQVTGDQRMNRMGAIIRPLNSTSSYSNFTLAEVIGGIIKNIEAVSNAKSAYDTAFDHAVGHGFGYWRILTEYADDDSFDQDIRIKRINNAFRVRLDPSAEEVTKIDAKWGFITSMVDKDEYPDADWDFGKGEEYSYWHSGDKGRIAEYYRLVPEKIIIWLVDNKPIKVKDSKIDIRNELTKSGVVPEKTKTAESYRCEWFKMSAKEIFERGEVPTKYIPIVPCYGKVLNVRGRDIYRGVIRYAKDPQRIYNYTRTASIEQVALAPKAPWVVEESQLGDHAKQWETANIKNYSTLIYKNKPGVPPPIRQMPPQPSSGWISEAQISDQDIDSASGMYKASLGAPSNERSGKAINARKVEGDVGTYHFHDNRALSLEHSYKILVDMIPRVYDSNRIVRITKFDDEEEIIEINKTITDNDTGKIVKMYDLSMGKYDVAVDIGASYTTQRQMASESMMELIQYAPQTANKIMPIIAENLDWPQADKIADALTETKFTQEEVQSQIQKAVLQATQKTKADEKIQLDTFKSITDRLSMQNKANNDDDKLELELIKLLEDNGVTDQEVYGRAIELIRQVTTPVTAETVGSGGQVSNQMPKQAMMQGESQADAPQIGDAVMGDSQEIPQ